PRTWRRPSLREPCGGCLYHRGGVITDEGLWEAVPASDVGVRVRLVAANMLGVALVALEAFVVGVPSTGNRSVTTANILSGIAGLAYNAVAVPIELIRATRQARRTFTWVRERGDPTDAEIAAVFEYPVTQAIWIFGWWSGGAVLVGGLNLVAGNNLAYSLRAGLDIALGGLTAAALSFLLLERFNRPVFALALATGADRVV